MLNMKGKWLLTFFALVSIVVNTYGQCEPAGGCPNGNCYCISDATVTDRSGTLYDDGGPDRDYKAGEEETAQVINYIFTIEPAGGADTIVLQFPMFDVEFDANCTYDHLQIIDGTTPVGIYCGSDNPGLIFCTSGSVTLRWFSDPNAVEPGFEMRWFSDSIPPEIEVPVVTTEPCEPVLDPNCNRGIQQIVLREIDNTTGINCTDWDHRDKVAYFQAGDNDIMEGYIYGLYDFDTFSAFIDWSNDGLDVTDIIYQNSVIYTLVLGYYDVPIVVPPLQEPGGYRMRVRNESLGTGDPCLTTGPGEYEDYTLIVEGDLPRCAENGQPNNTMACFTTEFTWDANSAGAAATSYILVAQDAETGELIIDSVEVTGTSYTHPFNLPSNSMIDWFVLPKNANGVQTGCAMTGWTFTTGEPQTSVKFIEDSISICPNTPVQIDPNPQFGEINSIDDYNHQWSGSGVSFLDRVDTSLVTFSSGQPGLYTLIYSAPDLVGCSEVDSILVNVKDFAVSGTIVGSNGVCLGDSISLELDGYQGSIEWQDSLAAGGNWTTIANETDSLLMTYSEEDVFLRAIVTTDGCFDTTVNHAIVMNQLPALPEFSISSHTGAFYVCRDVPVSIQSTNYNAPTDSLVWENDSVSSLNYIVEEEGFVSLIYTDANGCSSEDSVYVDELFVEKPPVLYPAGNAQICPGDEVEYRVLNYLDSLRWMDGVEGKLNTFDTDLSEIYVVYTNEFGCTRSSDTVTVEVVNNLEKPIVTISPSDDVCVGDSVFFKVTNYANNLYWNDSASTIGSELRIKTTQVRDYAYVVRFSTDNCDAFESVEITANPTPETPLVGLNGDAVLEVQNPEQVTYEWFDEDGILVQASTDPVFTPDSTGNYTCAGVNQFGCRSFLSDPVFFDRSIGVNELASTGVKIYPNPSNGTFFVKKQNTDDAIITIYSILGQKVKEVEVGYGKQQESISGLEKGQYIVHIQTAGKFSVESIIVE
mgnify:CR=1 FL=1